jgi:hypothetical protein
MAYQPKVGDKLPDGTVYAGVSPETNKPMYATPEDAPFTYHFFGATEYAAKLEAHGHRDWPVPSKGELNVLFNNRAAIGGFNSSKWGLISEYWSASQVKLSPPNDDSFASSQNFSDGFQSTNHKFSFLALRCVR